MRRLLLAIGVLAMLAGCSAEAEEAVPTEGLALWLRASEGVTATAQGQVSAWRDAREDSELVAVPLAGPGPALVTQGLNGRPVLRFPGNAALTLNQAVTTRTLFVVARYAAPAFVDYPGLLGGGVDDPNHGHLLNGLPGKAEVARGTSFYARFERNGEARTAQPGGGYDLAPIDKFWEALAVLPADQTQVVVIGQVSGGGRFWKGDVAEILLYSRTLDDGETKAVTGYLMDKYNLSVPQGEAPTTPPTATPAATPPPAPGPTVPAGSELVRPTDTRLAYSDYARLTLEGTQARFDRLLAASSGFNFDNPGARIRFRSDAARLVALLEYTAEHLHGARNGTGVFLVDGKAAGTYSFEHAAGHVQAPLPADGQMHLYEIVLPYAESVVFRGLGASPGATFAPAPARPAFRYVAHGDSITEGYQASDPLHNYPALIGARNGWEVVNMGFGGRTTVGSDGAALGSLRGDLITILIGFNDYNGQRAVAQYEASLREIVAGIRVAQPKVPVYLITPLWSSSAHAVPLEEYRQAVKRVAEGAQDANLHLVDGLKLIDNDAKYFPDGIHPNDAGFAQMAERLGALLKPGPTP